VYVTNAVTLKGFFMTTLTTEDEVLKMAEQCGLPEFENNESQAANLVMFAKLVAEAEREACAKVIENDCIDDMTREEEAAAIRARGQHDSNT